MSQDRSRREIERQAEANRRALFVAETIALALLLRRRNAAVTAAAAAGMGAVMTAGRIETAMKAGIAELRTTSRAAGYSRLRAEAASLGFEIGRGGAILHAKIAEDVLRARITAESYAKRWLRSAIGKTGGDALEAANEATAGSVRRIAVSESAEAYSGGRTAHAARLRAIELLRVWDSANDRDVCATCAGADGTIVGIREKFPEGEPGDVHSFCRCTWTLLTKSEAGNGTLIEAA